VFSAEEFKSYTALDSEMLLRYKRAEELPEDMSQQSLFLLFRNDFISNYNKYAVKGEYQIRIVKYTENRIVSDVTLNRLDIALYYSNNKEISELIAQNVRKDKTLQCDVNLSSISEIEKIRRAKIDYVENVRKGGDSSGST
jgi:hypothetical protein